MFQCELQIPNFMHLIIKNVYIKLDMDNMKRIDGKYNQLDAA
jgi:hypothetical protein